MADEKPKRSPEDRRAKMYDRASAKPVAAEKKDEPAPKKKDEPAAGGEGKPAEKAAPYKDMMKRHEAERRDAHGAHKENLRKIATRHEGEINTLMEQVMGEGGAEADGAAPGGAAADGGEMAAAE